MLRFLCKVNVEEMTKFGDFNFNKIEIVFEFFSPENFVDMKTFIFCCLVLTLLFVNAYASGYQSTSYPYGDENSYGVKTENDKSQWDSQSNSYNTKSSENHKDDLHTIEKDSGSNFKNDKERSSNQKEENELHKRNTDAKENDEYDQFGNKLTFAKENSDNINKLKNTKYSDNNNDIDQSELVKNNYKKASSRNAAIDKQSSSAAHAEETDNKSQSKGIAPGYGSGYGGWGSDYTGSAASDDSNKYHQQNHKFANDALWQDESSKDLDQASQLAKKNLKQRQNSKDFENTEAFGKDTQNKIYFDNANDKVSKRSSKTYKDDSLDQRNIWADQQYEKQSQVKDAFNRLRENKKSSDDSIKQKEQKSNDIQHDFNSGDFRKKGISNDHQPTYGYQKPYFNHDDNKWW
eukprot:gene827-9077_t